jgi:hypothetical protein
MIEHPDIDHFEDLGQGTGEFKVFFTGFDAAGGVVMGQDDCRGIESQRLLDDLPGMNRGSVDRSPSVASVCWMASCWSAACRVSTNWSDMVISS